ncbi:MAG: restriction endonuclease subunit S [Xanthomonadaceae bacterium]|nr:restriction endonuclease subunit S [Xanthomonadaceae bacterium]
MRYEAASKVEKRRLRHGDIVLEISGGSSAKGQPTGRTVFIDDRVLAALGDTVIPASFCRLVRVNPEVICARFAYYWLQDMYVSGRAFAYESQSTGISNFQFERFLDAEQLYLPSMAEQEAIAGTLAAIDDRRVLLRQTNATLEAIAQALFKSWFIDFDAVRAKAEGREPEGMDAATAALFPAELEDAPLGLIPKGWSLEEIGRVVECVGGGTPSTKEPAFWEPAIHRWATPKDLSGLGSPVLLDTERRLSDAGLNKVSSGLLPAGTLLLSSRAPIGYLAIAEVPLAINQGFIAMKPGGRLTPEFLYFWCQANMDAIKQKANGSTFMEISKAAFRPIPALLPPPALVARFSDFARTVFDRVTAGERQRSTLGALRDTLLPRLISGKLRLPEARAQVEEALA